MLGRLTGFLDGLDRFPHRRLLTVAVVLMAAAGLFILLWQPGSSARGQKTVVTRDDAATQEAAKVMVHVAGAVVRPEVYVMKEGARVAEAIERAGGLLPDADIATINLAEKCRDGQKIYVPHAGEIESEGLPGGVAPKVNLNTASLKQLDELPGIGPKLAAEIIAYREKNNGFSGIEELKQVKGIGDSKFEDLRELVTI